MILTSDTARTPLAVSRFKEYMSKIGPVASATLKKTLDVAIDEGVKKLLGFDVRRLSSAGKGKTYPLRDSHTISFDCFFAYAIQMAKIASSQAAAYLGWQPYLGPKGIKIVSIPPRIPLA